MAEQKIRSQEWVDKIEDLVHRAESIPDPNARNVTIELLRAVLDFHAAALERIMDLICESGPVGEAIVEKIGGDDLTSSMLLLHDLHPDALETRLDRALEKLRRMFLSLGAKLSLLGIEGDIVRLHFESDREWSGTAVNASIEKAILQAAPEIRAVILEGLKETRTAGFVPVSDLLAGMHA